MSALGLTIGADYNEPCATRLFNREIRTR